MTYFLNLRISRAEKKIENGKRLGPDKLKLLGERYEEKAARLPDALEQAKLFARAADIMRQAGKPALSYDYYMKAAALVQSKSDSYKLSAIRADPKHPNAPAIARELADAFARSAVQKLADADVLGIRDDLPKRIYLIQEAVRFYERAADVLAPYDRRAQLSHLEMALKTLKPLDSTPFYPALSDSEQRAVRKSLNALHTQISELSHQLAFGQV